VGPTLHGNQVDDVAYQVQGVAPDGIEEIQQLSGLAIRCAKMDIRDEDAAIIAHGASCIVRPAVRVQEKL
jgi:hypothetical protein